MSNKQSSIDFYAEKSVDLFNLFQQGSISINDFRARMLIIEIEAKEMHEEEITKAITFGQNNHTVMISHDLIIATEYYNETYGGNNEQ